MTLLLDPLFIFYPHQSQQDKALRRAAGRFVQEDASTRWDQSNGDHHGGGLRTFGGGGCFGVREQIGLVWKQNLPCLLWSVP